MKLVNAAIQKFNAEDIQKVEADGKITIEVDGKFVDLSIDEVEISSQDIEGGGFQSGTNNSCIRHSNF